MRRTGAGARGNGGVAREHLSDLRARLLRSSSACSSPPHPRSALSTAASTRSRPLPFSIAATPRPLRDGALIRSTSQLNAGDQLTTRLADGTFLSRMDPHSPHPPRPNPERKARTEPMTASTTRKLSAPTAFAPSRPIPARSHDHLHRRPRARPFAAQNLASAQSPSRPRHARVRSLDRRRTRRRPPVKPAQPWKAPALCPPQPSPSSRVPTASKPASSSPPLTIPGDNGISSSRRRFQLPDSVELAMEDISSIMLAIDESNAHQRQSRLPGRLHSIPHRLRPGSNSTA